VLHLLSVDAGEARQKTQKTQQFVRGAQGPIYASRPWCILRVHCDKRVLHLLPVDAGAARQKTHKNTAICQRCLEANLRIKTTVHPEGAL
jgi:hypothetical protein